MKCDNKKYRRFFSTKQKCDLNEMYSPEKKANEIFTLNYKIK